MSMTQKRALDLAIFAINTMQHPDASSAEDVADLDANAEEAVETLSTMRAAIEGLDRYFTMSLSKTRNPGDLFGPLRLEGFVPPKPTLRQRLKPYGPVLPLGLSRKVLTAWRLGLVDGWQQPHELSSSTNIENLGDARYQESLDRGINAGQWLRSPLGHQRQED